MIFESEEEKQALEQLVDIAQRFWEKEVDTAAAWPKLKKALLITSPLVFPDFDIKVFLGEE